MKSNILIVVCCIFLPTAFSFSQTDSVKQVQVLGGRFHQGYLFIHSKELRPLGRPYPIGGELNFGWHKTSRKAWESCNCYTKLSLSLAYWDYDNREVLGRGLISLFTLEPVFGAGNLFSFTFQASFGLSYQDTPYDPETNPDNLGYSTYIAFPLRLGFGTYIRLSPRFYLDVILAYNHFSNGGMKEPNKGLNWITASLGLSYYLKTPQFFKREKIPWRSLGPPETRLDLFAFTTYQQPISKKFLFSFGAELKGSRQVARVNAITLGMEWMYDSGRNFQMDQIEQSGTAHSLGAAIGHEFLLGKFIFSQQFGFYLLKPPIQSADVYQRYGLVFRLSRKLGIGINLRSHGHVADFLDVRFGYFFL